MSERSNAETYVGECFVKCSHIILSSRLHEAPRRLSDSRASRWFLLEHEQVEGVSCEVESWRKDLSCPLIIEIYAQPHWGHASSQPNGKQAHSGRPTAGDLLLERWILNYDRSGPPPVPPGGAGGTRNFLEDTTIYKRLTLLVRSLFTYTRVLPAFRICRATKKGQRAHYRVYHTVSRSVPPAPGASRGDSSAPPSLVTGKRHFSFAPVATPAGQFSISLESLPAENLRFLESSTAPIATPPPRAFFIPDYLGPDTKPMVQFPTDSPSSVGHGGGSQKSQEPQAAGFGISSNPQEGISVPVAVGRAHGRAEFGQSPAATGSAGVHRLPGYGNATVGSAGSSPGSQGRLGHVSSRVGQQNQDYGTGSYNCLNSGNGGRLSQGGNTAGTGVLLAPTAMASGPVDCRVATHRLGASPGSSAVPFVRQSWGSKEPRVSFSHHYSSSPSGSSPSVSTPASVGTAHSGGFVHMYQQRQMQLNLQQQQQLLRRQQSSGQSAPTTGSGQVAEEGGEGGAPYSGIASVAASGGEQTPFPHLRESRSVPLSTPTKEGDDTAGKVIPSPASGSIFVSMVLGVAAGPEGNSPSPTTMQHRQQGDVSLTTEPWGREGGATGSGVSPLDNRGAGSEVVSRNVAGRVCPEQTSGLEARAVPTGKPPRRPQGGASDGSDCGSCAPPPSANIHSASTYAAPAVDVFSTSCRQASNSNSNRGSSFIDDPAGLQDRGSSSTEPARLAGQRTTTSASAATAAAAAAAAASSVSTEHGGASADQASPSAPIPIQRIATGHRNWSSSTDLKAVVVYGGFEEDEGSYNEEEEDAAALFGGPGSARAASLAGTCAGGPGDHPRMASLPSPAHACRRRKPEDGVGAQDYCSRVAQPGSEVLVYESSHLPRGLSGRASRNHLAPASAPSAQRGMLGRALGLHKAAAAAAAAANSGIAGLKPHEETGQTGFPPSFAEGARAAGKGSGIRRPPGLDVVAKEISSEAAMASAAMGVDTLDRQNWIPRVAPPFTSAENFTRGPYLMKPMSSNARQTGFRDASLPGEAQAAQLGGRMVSESDAGEGRFSSCDAAIERPDEGPSFQQTSRETRVGSGMAIGLRNPQGFPVPRGNGDGSPQLPFAFTPPQSLPSSTSLTAEIALSAGAPHFAGSDVSIGRFDSSGRTGLPYSSSPYSTSPGSAYRLGDHGASFRHGGPPMPPMSLPGVFVSPGSSSSNGTIVGRDISSLAMISRPSWGHRSLSGSSLGFGGKTATGFGGESMNGGACDASLGLFADRGSASPADTMQLLLLDEQESPAPPAARGQGGPSTAGGIAGRGSLTLLNDDEALNGGVAQSLFSSNLKLGKPLDNDKSKLLAAASSSTRTRAEPGLGSLAHKPSSCSSMSSMQYRGNTDGTFMAATSPQQLIAGADLLLTDADSEFMPFALDSEVATVVSTTAAVSGRVSGDGVMTGAGGASGGVINGSYLPQAGGRGGWDSARPQSNLRPAQPQGQAALDPFSPPLSGRGMELRGSSRSGEAFRPSSDQDAAAATTGMAAGTGRQFASMLHTLPESLTLHVPYALERDVAVGAFIRMLQEAPPLSTTMRKLGERNATALSVSGRFSLPRLNVAVESAPGPVQESAACLSMKREEGSMRSSNERTNPSAQTLTAAGSDGSSAVTDTPSFAMLLISEAAAGSGLGSRIDPVAAVASKTQLLNAMVDRAGVIISGEYQYEEGASRAPVKPHCSSSISNAKQPPTDGAVDDSRVEITEPLGAIVSIDGCVASRSKAGEVLDDNVGENPYSPLPRSSLAYTTGQEKGMTAVAGATGEEGEGQQTQFAALSQSVDALNGSAIDGSIPAIPAGAGRLSASEDVRDFLLNGGGGCGGHRDHVHDGEAHVGAGFGASPSQHITFFSTCLDEDLDAMDEEGDLVDGVPTVAAGVRQLTQLLCQLNELIALSSFD